MPRPHAPRTPRDFEAIYDSLQKIIEALENGGKKNVKLCEAADKFRISLAGLEPDAVIKKGEPPPVPGRDVVVSSVSKNAAIHPQLRAAFLALIDAIPNVYHDGTEESESKLLADVYRTLEEFERFAPRVKSGAAPRRKSTTERQIAKDAATRGRKKRKPSEKAKSIKEAERLIQKWKASGLTRSEFCDRENLKPKGKNVNAITRAQGRLRKSKQ